MLIDYKGVNICHDDVNILETVDFHADEGEFIYIIGKVGSGKSSLLKTIYCELDIESAEKAEVLGCNICTIKRKDIPALRKEMGIIFQDFQLLHDRTIYNNLYFVLKATGWKDKKKINERIDEVLTEVGLQDRKDVCHTNCPEVSNNALPSPVLFLTNLASLSQTSRQAIWIQRRLAILSIC